MSRLPQETTTLPPESEPAPEARSSLRLTVLGGQAPAVYVLPPRGELSIGRGAENDVRIDAPSISRRHALLRLGEVPEIVDLDSSNGTHVEGERLAAHAPRALGIGVPLRLGSTTVVIEMTVADLEWRRQATHRYFELRLTEECERYRAKRQTFGLLRLRIADTAQAAVTEETVARQLRASDLLGAYGPGEYEVFLAACSPDHAEYLARRIDQALLDQGVQATRGLGCFPRDGRDAQELMAHAALLASGADPASTKGALRGHTPQMQRLIEQLEVFAAGNITVLLQGETGVGKEVFAGMLHSRSPRASKPLLRLNCAAFPESLLESELFGHERGAFTGAAQAKVGLLESARGGTVVLDEIGELPLAMQAKLLRVLESHQVLPVGGLHPRTIDVRFVASTNRDLEMEVARGNFRSDLFYRISAATLAIPPLRERVNEIAPLARDLVAEICRQYGRPNTCELSPTSIELLEAYRWPGNIRELRNTLERAILLCGVAIITPEFLPLDKMRAARVEPAEASAPGEASPVAAQGSDLRSQVEALERKHILDALDQCGGNQSRAAQLLGISRGTLQKRLDVYGITRPRKGR